MGIKLNWGGGIFMRPHFVSILYMKFFLPSLVIIFLFLLFLDSILHPYVTSLSSYVKDTTDFIKKVKNIKFCSKDSYLVTLDVSSLYTNIPHEDGIQACKSSLEKDGISTERITEIEELMKLVLGNNHFKFDGKHYLQKLGTAMGSSMAPLFMGKFEEDFYNLERLHQLYGFGF